jgi:hypothetical protein
MTICAGQSQASEVCAIPTLSVVTMRPCDRVGLQQTGGDHSCENPKATPSRVDPQSVTNMCVRAENFRVGHDK